MTIDPDRQHEFANIDWDRPYDRSDWPHDPSLYHKSDHFVQRCKESWRHLDDEVVGKTIALGQVKNNNDGCAAFHRWDNGIVWWVIAGWHISGYRLLVSGWPYLKSRKRAERSGLFPEAMLAHIQAANDAKRAPTWEDEWAEYNEWRTD